MNLLKRWTIEKSKAHGWYCKAFSLVRVAGGVYTHRVLSSWPIFSGCFTFAKQNDSSNEAEKWKWIKRKRNPHGARGSNWKCEFSRHKCVATFSLSRKHFVKQDLGMNVIVRRWRRNKKKNYKNGVGVRNNLFRLQEGLRLNNITMVHLIWLNCFEMAVIVMQI